MDFRILLLTSLIVGVLAFLFGRRTAPASRTLVRMRKEADARLADMQARQQAHENLREQAQRELRQMGQRFAQLEASLAGLRNDRRDSLARTSPPEELPVTDAWAYALTHDAVLGSASLDSTGLDSSSLSACPVRTDRRLAFAPRDYAPAEERDADNDWHPDHDGPGSTHPHAA